MMPRSLLCCAVLLLFLMSSSATSSTIPTTVFSYEIEVCVRNEGARPLDVKMAIPFLPLFPNTTWQTALVLNASHPLMEIISDEDGNPGLLLNVSVILEPGENLTLTAEYKIISKYREPPNVIFEQSGRISDIPEQLTSEFCCETGCWTINFKPLRELAFNLTGGERNVLKVISSFIIWIYENVAYHPFETPLYPNETYVNKMGAYDDQVNLLISAGSWAYPLTYRSATFSCPIIRTSCSSGPGTCGGSSRTYVGMLGRLLTHRRGAGCPSISR